MIHYICSVCHARMFDQREHVAQPILPLGWGWVQTGKWLDIICPICANTAPRDSPPVKAISAAIAAGQRSGCRKSQRCAVIFEQHDTHLTRAFSVGTNRPADVMAPCDDSPQCRRDCARICLHAEQVAIVEHLRTGRHQPPRGPHDILHLKLVDGKPIHSGQPSCFECSKLIIAAGLQGVWLLQENGWKRWTSPDFHRATLVSLGLHQG